MKYVHIVIAAMSVLVLVGAVQYSKQAAHREAQALSALQDCLNSKPLFLRDDTGAIVAFVLCEVSKEQHV